MSDIYIKPKHSLKSLPNHLDKIKSEQKERKRSILYLILDYLKTHKLDNAAEAIKNEAQLGEQLEVCENIDLDIILQEYQSYYYTKFQKYPKIIRKLSDGVMIEPIKTSAKANSAKQKNKPTKTNEKNVSPTESDSDFHFEIVSLDKPSKTGEISISTPPNTLSKALCDFESYSSENRDLLNQIVSQIIPSNSCVKWEDCIGLEDAVERLKESTVYPTRFPELFENFTTWKGILLHGPPGTGKTLLAKALASEGNTTFFNVTSSTFISKWRGESEKMIKHLFEAARELAPSTIFFDEIDALSSKARDFQHEASRRFESELLINIDGLLQSEQKVFVLATTNSPWNLNGALLRRFDKRILVNLPNVSSRTEIFKHYLKSYNHKLSQDNLEELGSITQNLSGSDIKVVCKEAAMEIIRGKIRQVNRGKKTNVDMEKITMEDVKKALRKIKPSVTENYCKKYEEWNCEYGSW